MERQPTFATTPLVTQAISRPHQPGPNGPWRWLLPDLSSYHTELLWAQGPRKALPFRRLTSEGLFVLLAHSLASKGGIKWMKVVPETTWAFTRRPEIKDQKSLLLLRILQFWLGEGGGVIWLRCWVFRNFFYFLLVSIYFLCSLQRPTKTQRLLYRKKRGGFYYKWFLIIPLFQNAGS